MIDTVEYISASSTFGVVSQRGLTARNVVDERPWYRRWWFGLIRFDGEMELGLGPVSIRNPFNANWRVR